MVREIITLSIGECGIQLGQTVWDQYCAEHKIDEIGKKHKENDNDNTFLCFYEETKAGQYIPRNMMIDLEPNIIDNVRSSKYSKILHPDFLVSGKEDAANIFARGYNTVGEQMLELIHDRLRILVESCDNAQGFIMNRSVGGGTGSGLGSLILRRIGNYRKKKHTLGFDVFPSPTDSMFSTDPYNAALSMDHLLGSDNHVSVVYDNQKIYEICQRKHNGLNIADPSHRNMNLLIAKNISSITASFRYGTQHFSHSMSDLNILGFRRQLIFLTPAMGSIVPRTYPFEKIYKSVDNSPLIQQLNVPSIINEEIAEYATFIPPVIDESMRGITENCFNGNNFFVDIDDFDVEEDFNLGLVAMYRGNVKPKEANRVVQWAKTNKKIAGNPWVPTGFKVEIHDENYAILADDAISVPKISMASIGNMMAIWRFFRNRIYKTYDRMYSQKAFVHWFVGEGMEESELTEARENLEQLEQDYLIMGCYVEEQTDDDEYSDVD